MASDNWTDCDLPCFSDYIPSFGEDDGPMECLQSDGDYTECLHLFRGGRWATCPEGALSRYCPDCLRPQGRGK